MIASWEAVVGAAETFDQSVSHGALKHYDLADVAPLVRTGKVTITETIDAMGNATP